ncbi:MAG: hypothetical protein Q8P05_05790 [Candidatus Diapherotrites archaeon]|nr:hypothetical protein [Candidatus Diapherotrites archaeon]MDZ4256607.1 hypothetical protein [archaeon]
MAFPLQPPQPSFFSQQRAQVSIELIIVMAAVVAVVLLLVTQLQSSSATGVKKLEDKTNDIFKQIDKIK